MSNIAARLEAMPYSRYHRRLLFMGGLGYAFDGFDAAILAFIYPILAKLWGLAPVQVGLLGSATYMGFFFGAIGAGVIADRTGRRMVMMGALVLYTSFSLVSAFCHDWHAFFACRFIAGMGIGAESAVIAPFLTEFVSSRYRGLFTGSLASFFSFGFAGAALTCGLVLPNHPTAWRLLLACSAAPILLLVWWSRRLPESPRWLSMKGREREAQAVVADMERQSGVASPESGDPSQAVPQPQRRQGGALKLLFSRELIGVTLMTWMVWSAITSSYYAFFTWLPSLVASSHLGGSKPVLYTTVVYAAQIPGYFSAAFMNERIGRRATIISYMSLGCAAALWFAMAQGTTQFLLAGMLLSFAMNGSYAGVYAYTPEVFPTRVRATGAGLASAIGRLGAIASPVLVGFLYQRVGLVGVFGATTAVLFAGVMAVVVLGVSTKNRSLEDIEAEKLGLSPTESAA